MRKIVAIFCSAASLRSMTTTTRTFGAVTLLHDTPTLHDVRAVAEYLCGLLGVSTATLTEPLPSGTLVRVVLREKDLNGRGNGTQDVRRARTPDGRLGWATDLAIDVQGSWAAGTFTAAQRQCQQTGMLPVGTILLAYDTGFRKGQKMGPPKITAGIVDADPDARGGVDWCLSTRGTGRDVEVLSEGRWIAMGGDE